MDTSNTEGQRLTGSQVDERTGTAVGYVNRNKENTDLSPEMTRIETMETKETTLRDGASQRRENSAFSQMGCGMRVSQVHTSCVPPRMCTQPKL